MRTWNSDKYKNRWDELEDFYLSRDYSSNENKKKTKNWFHKLFSKTCDTISSIWKKIL